MGFGLGFNVMPQLFAQLPETVQMFTGNGIVISSLTAIVLNLLFNGLKEEKVPLHDIVEEEVHG